MAKKNNEKKAVKTKEIAESLEETHSAISLSFQWVGMSRKFTESQKEEAAGLFGAKQQSVSMSKKLFDTTNPAFKKLTKIKNEMYMYWRWNSLPFPEDGIRLFQKKHVDEVIAEFVKMKDRFDEAVKELNNVYYDLIEKRKENLGSLYDPADYPASLLGAFNVEWNFHNVAPPNYLMTLRPDLYAQEEAKMKNRFEEAVRLAERAFTEELSKLVSHLSERLSSKDDKGNRVIFKESSIENLYEFFDRFKKLNIKSNPALDKLVEDAKQMVSGIDADTVRHNYPLRDNLAKGMDLIKENLEGMMEAEPARRVKRGGYAPQEGVTV